MPPRAASRPTLAVFVGTSLDGFIARPDGAIDWLEGPDGAGPAPDFGFATFLATVDLLVMGSATFETVAAFPEWPYGALPVHVLSSRAVTVPERLAATVSSSAEPPAELCERLAQDGVQRVYVDGGVTVQRFLAAGLVDELTITILPILIGEGRPLFGPLPADQRLRLVETRSYPSGHVQLRYTR